MQAMTTAAHFLGTVHLNPSLGQSRMQAGCGYPPADPPSSPQQPYPGFEILQSRYDVHTSSIHVLIRALEDQA
ncbi:hypothetical protein BJX66DRAFT_53400 [Aspergillus keveii]|uniref:Uncharacterized protein n=1 Tax=Aspergillus keveii TaxID=714993 RepID=A0ABR4FRF1_9EURO